jgi:hypothetical protein
MGAVFHVFVYLAHNHNVRVMFGPTYPVVDMCSFVKTAWEYMYADVK